MRNHGEAKFIDKRFDEKIKLVQEARQNKKPLPQSKYFEIS